MRRAILSIALAIAVSSVAAQAAITHSVTLTGTYTVTFGASQTIVDVYKVTLDAGPGRLLGAIVMGIGSITGEGDDPFQAAWRSGGKTPVTNLTPTKDDADYWLTPPDSSQCYEADSHFLPAGIADWTPVVTAPTETNDGSIYYPGSEDYVAGVGSLDIATAVPVAVRTRVMDVVRVGVIRGTAIWVRSASADDLGVVTTWSYPEPATLSLLALGALSLLRRRR